MIPEPPDLPADRLLARKEQVMTAFLELQPERPKPARSRRRRVLALAGVVTAAAAAAATGLVVAQPAAKPAFALSPNGDGSVTFTINDSRDAEGATEALRAAGIRGVVLPGHRFGRCPADQRGTRDPRHWSSLRTAVESFEYRKAHPEAAHSTVIRPDEIPDGAILVIGTWDETPLAGKMRGISAELFVAPGPACLEEQFDWEHVVASSPSPTG